MFICQRGKLTTTNEELPAVIEQEVIMHEKTFHQAEVKKRIEILFGN